MKAPLPAAGLLALALLAALLVPAEARAADLDASLVTIKVTTQGFDHHSPWRKRPPAQQELQGCVIEGPFILTVASPLADSVLVEVSKHGSPRRYAAAVVLADYVAGLALLTVTEAGFFADLTPLSIAPPGPPAGTIRITRWEAGGIFREFEASVIKTSVDYFTPLGATLAHFMSTEMDRGGSGEAVVADGRLVGLAYYLEPASKNLKVHAVEVLRRLLADRADGAYDGYPSTWEYARGLDGDRSLKAWLGMSDGETGVLVTAVPPRMSGAGSLERDDVLLAVDGRTIDDSGLYRSASYGMLHYESLLFLDHQVGDSVPLRVLRRGKRIDVSVRLLPLDGEAFLIPPALVDAAPDYLIFGGVVFQELTRSYLLGTWGNDWWRTADVRFLHYYAERSLFPGPDARRLVILNRVLPHAVNEGYQSESDAIVEALDGAKLRDLAHLRELLDSSQAAFAVFSLAGGDRIVLRRDRALAAEKEILERYGVPAASSFAARAGG